MQNQKDIIIITAAARTSTWLRELVNPGRMLGEKFIEGYKEKMDILRSVDDRIYDWLGDLKQLVKQMHTAQKANRLVDVAILLHQLNTKFNQVSETRNELKQLEESELGQFDTGHELELPDDMLSAFDGLESSAGVISDFKRRWVAKHLENENRVKRQKAVKSLVDGAFVLTGKVEDLLSAMSKARASGNIGAYISLLDKLSRDQQEFKAKFTPTYEMYLAPVVNSAIEEKRELDKRVKKEQTWLKEQKLLREKAEKQKAEKQMKEPAKIEPVPITQSGPITVPAGPIPEAFLQQPKSVPISQPKSVPPISEQEPGSIPPGPDTYEDSGPPTVENPPITLRSLTNVEKIMLKRSHDSFVKELIKEANNNDPYLMSVMLIKYAEQIEDLDLEKSLQLLAIAEGIIDE